MPQVSYVCTGQSERRGKLGPLRCADLEVLCHPALTPVQSQEPQPEVIILENWGTAIIYTGASHLRKSHFLNE